MTHYSEPEWPPQGGQPPQQPGGPPSAGQPGYEQPSYGQPPYGYPEQDQPPYGPPSYGPPSYGRPSYGPPSYGPPGGYPPGPGGPGSGPYEPPPRNRKAPWIAGGIAVLAVAGIAVALILTLSSNNSSGNATTAVAILLRADVNKDLKTAQNITCEPLHSQINESFVQNPDKSYRIGKATENGDTATVASTIVDANNNTLNVVFDVEKQNGTWKVCNVTEGGAGGGGSGVPGGTAFPSLPTGLPSGGGTGSFCITPNGSTPICVPN